MTRVGDAMNHSKERLNKSSKMLSLFMGCNTFVDYEIGSVLDIINKKIPDALVIVTSDYMKCYYII
jgi:arylsulfatase A-like enzyme